MRAINIFSLCKREREDIAHMDAEMEAAMMEGGEGGNNKDGGKDECEGPKNKFPLTRTRTCAQEQGIEVQG